MYGGVKLWIKLWYMYDKLCESCWVWLVILTGPDGWPLWALYGDGAGDPHVCLPVVPHPFHGKIPTVSGLSHSGSFPVRGNCLFFKEW